MQFIGPWADGSPIPPDFTCDGAGEAPLVTWTAPPDGTVELAMSVVLLDSDGFVLWLVIGLPPEAGSLGGGEPVAVGTEALNSNGAPGWLAPCPPPEDAAHTYQFTLHLLDQAVTLPADTPAPELLAAIEAATVDRTMSTGTYQRA
jgi:phosphatidylethanolamine-binding protein (PEBP) family uncharacterized protein